MKCVLWDFDGTLGERPGGLVGCIREALDFSDPESRATEGDIRQALRGRFPWHNPTTPHSDIKSADAWWKRYEPELVLAFRILGATGSQARDRARYARMRFIDVNSWVLYADARPNLERLRREGWNQIILSNHVPELESIVSHLGIRGLVTGIVNSAFSGYEKPHPEAFRSAWRSAGCPRNVCMVGDRYETDIVGARCVGIPGILLDRDGHLKPKVEGHSQRASSLFDVADILHRIGQHFILE